MYSQVYTESQSIDVFTNLNGVYGVVGAGRCYVHFIFGGVGAYFVIVLKFVD